VVQKPAVSSQREEKKFRKKYDPKIPEWWRIWADIAGVNRSKGQVV